MHRRLIFLAQTLPFPPDSGQNIRTYYTLRILANSFDVRALMFYRRSGIRSEENVRRAEQSLSDETGARVSAFPIPTEQSRLTALRTHLKSIFTGRPYTYFTYRSLGYRRALAKALLEAPADVVHFDSLDLTYSLDAVKRLAPAAVRGCTHHNVESALLKRFADAETHPLRRMYIRHQANLYAREEQNYCPDFHLNVTVSDEDAEVLATSTGASFRVIPNGVDTSYFTPPARPGSKGILFVGGTTWLPNRDALGYFTETILPRIRAEEPEVPVIWVGRCTQEEKTVYRERYGVELTGYVEDVRPYFCEAACMVVPLRIGGGTRLKITTAWAMGLPIVTTSIGREGLAGSHGRHFLLHDDPEDFAAAVVSLLRDPSLRQRLHGSGRALAEAEYSWDSLGERLRGYYDDLLDQRS